MICMAALVVITQYAQAGIQIGTGNPLVQALGYIGDPAEQGQGSGRDMQVFNVVVPLTAATPAAWLTEIRNGIIAAGAVMGVGFPLVVGRVFVPEIV